MRIVHLVGYYIPELGYQENYLAKEHKKLGHEVHVVTSNRLYPFPNIENIMKEAGAKVTSRRLEPGTYNVDGIKVHRLPAIFEYADFILVRGIKKKLREINPDIVFAHESRQSLPYYASLCKKDLGFALVTDQHDFKHEIPGHNPVLKLLRELDYALIRNPIVNATFRRSDAVIAVTSETKKYLMHTFGLADRDVQLVELGVDTQSYFKDKKSRKSIRARHRIKPNDVVFCFAGTIVRRKGIELLIDAFAEVSRKSAEAKLMIIGNGEQAYVGELKLLCRNLGIEKSSIFTGFIPKSKLPGYFSAADIGVWPGNNSVIIMEAMACELPIIMVDLQLSHLVGYGNGLKFNKGDGKALARLMTSLLDKNARSKMAKNSRRAVAQKYSYARIAKEFLQIGLDAKALKSKRV